MKPIRWVVIFFTVLIVVSLAPAWQSGGLEKPASAKTAQLQKPGSAKTAEPGAVVDINHASKDELKTLPGIGDAWANGIIRNRPYRNKTQLMSRNVLSAAAYKKIKDQIIAKQ